MAAVVALGCAAPALAAAGITHTQAADECVFQQRWEAPAGGGDPYINVDRGLCSVDITWGDTPDDCPRDPQGNDGRGGAGAYQKLYYRTAYDTGVIAGGDLVSGGPELPRLWTGALGVAPTTADLFDEVDGEKVVGVDVWKVKLHCYYGPDVESGDLQIRIVVRGPNYVPPGGGGGGGGGGTTPPPASGGGPAPAPTACDRRNRWDLDAAERRERRRLAELFQLNAWDGQRLAEDLDLFGLLLKALAADEGAGTRAAKRTIETVAGMLDEEAQLANRQSDLELERKLDLVDREAAAKRIHEAQQDIERLEGKLAKVKPKHLGTSRNRTRLRQLKVARQALAEAQHDFRQVDAALSRAQRELTQVTGRLKNLRHGLGDRLTKLSRLLADTEAGRALGSFLRVFNVAQDAAAAWMVVNAATAAILNQQARPPKGCDESWTKTLPGPAAARVGADAAAKASAAGAAGAAERGVATPVVASFGHLRPGRFLPGKRARAFNRALDLLGSQIRAVLPLVRSTSAARPAASPAAGRKLARLLVKGPARLRALAAAADLPRLPATARALRQVRHTAAPRALRAEIRRLGGRSLIAPARSVPGATAAGDLIDPFAPFRDPALDDLARRAASALAG